MSVFGIISEFNPFHNGHKYLFDKAREAGAEAIVAIMSGNAVQRGEVALLEKHERAKMALMSGADLVLELPFPWSASSAEAFALAGVAVASEFCDTLIFGSECGDISLLERAADICADQAFIERYKSTLKGNAGSAKTYFDLLSTETKSSYSSNDILGIEYIKAAKVRKSQLSFVTVKREGGAYASEEIEDGALQSASAIRALVAKGETEKLSDYMPSGAVSVLDDALLRGEITAGNRLDLAYKLFFRMKRAEELSGVAELDEGLLHRLLNAASECGEEELLAAMRTKRYTDARLRRAMLFSVTGVSVQDVKACPAYTELLGANERGRAILSAKRKTANIPVIAKPSDIPSTDEARRQRELSLALDSVFSLALERPQGLATVAARSPIII